MVEALDLCIIFNPQLYAPMPNVSLDLEPRYEGEIDAEVIGCETTTVSRSGFGHVSSDYGTHTAVWVPMEDGGSLHTTSYNQNKNRWVQTRIEKDGAVNIGTEEWAGTQIAVLVLEDTIEEE